MSTDMRLLPDRPCKMPRGSTRCVGLAGSGDDRNSPDLAVAPHDHASLADAGSIYRGDAGRMCRAGKRNVAALRRKQRGFTLLEVMIALLVIAIGLGAVITTTGESGWKSSHLKESTIASWVAYNEIALYRASRVWNDVKRRSGETEMANAEWEWSMEISPTDDDSLRRLDVEVTLKGDERVKARVTGFIGRL